MVLHHKRHRGFTTGPNASHFGTRFSESVPPYEDSFIITGLLVQIFLLVYKAFILARVHVLREKNIISVFESHKKAVFVPLENASLVQRLICCKQEQLHTCCMFQFHLLLV